MSLNYSIYESRTIECLFVQHEEANEFSIHLNDFGAGTGMSVRAFTNYIFFHSTMTYIEL